MTTWQDIRYGIRMLRKNLGFTAIALIMLAIGIGANTIMFSLVNALMFHTRKVKAPEQLMLCTMQSDQTSTFRYSEYLTLRDSGLAFSDLIAEDNGWGWRTTVARGDSAWHMSGLYVSANYFSVLGVPPERGRGFLPEEERPGSAPVAVLSYRSWKRMGSDPKLIGEVVNVNGADCQIVGIAQEGFSGVALHGPDIWFPLGSYRTVSLFARAAKNPAYAEYPELYIVGRVKPGLILSTAKAQLRNLFPDFKPEYLKDHPSPNPSIYLRPPGRFMVQGDDEFAHLAKTLFSLALMTSSVIILVIACLNLANMLIVRGISRRREIAVRLALGGDRWRIIRQLFTESLLLALLGGILGILLAFWGTRILSAWIAASPDYWTRNFRPVMNVRVLTVTLGLCLMATLLSGLRPALWLSKCDIAGEMKGSSGRVLGSLRRRRSALSVAGQITLAVALVLCATLLMRSALQIARPDARFPLTNKLVVQIDPDSTGYERDRTTQMCNVLADHLASLPGVKAMGTSGGLFYGGGGPVSIGEYQPGMGQRGSKGFLAQECALVNVGRDYFKAMEIPLLQGRFFDQRDRIPDAEKVTIIDETLARKFRPDGNALSCFIQWGVMNDRSDPYRVIGIVANMPGVGSRAVRAQMYEPAQSGKFSYLYFLATDRNSAGILQQRLAKEIHRIAPRIPVLSVAMLTKVRNDHVYIWVARFGARLGFAAGVTALFLAALGIYAIKGYLVASRTSEIGIRKALGATHGSIIGMVLREGLVLTMVALIVGLGLGLAVAKLSARMLYGISPIDPVSIVMTVIILGIVSLLASYIPARRAAKIDPMEALRYE